MVKRRLIHLVKTESLPHYIFSKTNKGDFYINPLFFTIQELLHLLNPVYQLKEEIFHFLSFLQNKDFKESLYICLRYMKGSFTISDIHKMGILQIVDFLKTTSSIIEKERSQLSKK
jgi:hypothetical protein